VGTSYQPVVVVGDLARVKDAMAAARVEGLVMPAGPGRTAVIPREDQLDAPARFAAMVSAKATGQPLANPGEFACPG